MSLVEFSGTKESCDELIMKLVVMYHNGGEGWNLTITRMLRSACVDTVKQIGY